MRADRLLQIMLLLQTERSMTAKELAERLEVSERTIFRDMEALSAAGVPVYAERGAQGGWRLAEGYRTDWTGFRKDELLSLLASRPHRHLADLGLAGHYEAALLKLLAGLSPALRRDADYMRQRLYVDAAGWHPSGEDVPWLSVLQEAVWEGRMLRLLYAAVSGGDGFKDERLVHPLGLVLKGSLWYLVAARDDERVPKTYRISRIRHAELLHEPSERPEDFDLAAYWQLSVDRFRSELPSYPVRALVHESVRGRLEQTRFVRISSWRGGSGGSSTNDDSGSWDGDASGANRDDSDSSDNSTNDDSGSRDGDARGVGNGESTSAGKGRSGGDAWGEAQLEFNTLESACDIVLGFGTTLQVLEPAELREALRNAALSIAELYKETDLPRRND